MKRQIISACALLLCTQLIQAQGNDQLYVDGKNRTLVDINGKPYGNEASPSVKGSPMLSETWAYGNVKFKNGKRADSMLLKFNQEINKFIFSYKDQVMLFADEVLECNFTAVEPTGMRDAVYRSNYPAVNGNNESSLYDVLADGGRVHLLRYARKDVQEYRVFNGPAVTEYSPSETIYIYDSTLKTMSRIKLKKSSVIEALPAMENRINQLCSKNGWDLKNIEQLKLLVAELNK